MKILFYLMVFHIEAGFSGVNESHSAGDECAGSRPAEHVREYDSPFLYQWPVC